MTDSGSCFCSPPNRATAVLRRLEAQYGRHAWAANRHDHPLDELVQTILSQHTSDLNSGRAFECLKARFDSWTAVAAASEEDVADAIRCGGLAEQKARSILQVLCRLLRQDGSTALDDLADLPLDAAKALLTSLPGVGPKTAACVLLFACGRPALPVDTHVFRVARRIGLISSQVSPERAHDCLEAQVTPEDVYSFHLSMIAHGRRVCLARSPRCDECVVLALCDYGRHASRPAEQSLKPTAKRVPETAGHRP